MDLKKVPKKMAKSIHLTIFLKINLMQKVLTIYISVQNTTKQIYNLDICKKKKHENVATTCIKAGKFHLLELKKKARS